MCNKRFFILNLKDNFYFLIRLIFGFVLSLFFLSLSVNGQEKLLLIRGASLIDVEAKTSITSETPITSKAPATRNRVQDILIEGERIKKIAPTGTIPISKKTKVVKADGKYIIPGLWDMHTHPDDPELWRMDVDSAARDWLMPQFVIYGVTGTRDMAGSLELVKSWKKRIRSGEMVGPEIFAAGPLLDGPNPMWDGSLGINDTAHVKHIVDSLRNAGVDFLKVYSLLPRDIYFALAAYANKINFPICGHVPLEVSTSEAAETGLNSQEHLLEILLECSSREEDLRNNTIDFGDAKGLDRYVLKQQLMLDTYDSTKAQKLFQTYKNLNIWHTPTLSMWRKNAWFELEYQSDKALYRYLPPYIRKYWTIGVNDHLNYRDHKGFIEIKRKLYQKYLEIISDMHKAGVKLLAGTDTGANPLCFPGIGVHNEVMELVRAGLSPVDALATATIHPAQYLNIDHDFGSLTEGKIADLVILDSNPLLYIQNIRSVNSVIKRGYLYDKKKRKKMLKRIARQLEE